MVILPIVALLIDVLQSFGECTMKQAFDKYVARVTKLDRHKYAAYVDIHVDHLWEMAVAGCGVRICSKRKQAEKVARQLVLLARQHEQTGHKPPH